MEKGKKRISTTNINKRKKMAMTRILSKIWLEVANFASWYAFELALWEIFVAVQVLKLWSRWKMSPMIGAKIQSIDGQYNGKEVTFNTRKRAAKRWSKIDSQRGCMSFCQASTNNHIKIYFKKIFHWWGKPIRGD